MSGIHINFNQIGRNIRKGFEHIPQEIAGVPDQLRKLGVDPGHLQEWIHHETQEVLQSVGGEVAKQMFGKSAEAAETLYNELKKLEQSKPNLVDALNEVSVSVSLSVLTLEYDKFYQRGEAFVGLLKTKANDFRLERNNIVWILENTLPKSISVNVSGELFSSLVSAGIGISVPMELAVELIDIILEKAGVPA